jgi:hypothetical protein
MSAAHGRTVLLANAVLDVVLGLLLLAGTWDGLWDALDLPQGTPALFVQVGGAALVGLAYLVWRAANEPLLRAPVSLAAAGADGIAALVVLAWLVSGDLPDKVDALGTILLIALAVVLGVFAVLKAGIARARPEAEEFRRPDQG